MLKISQASSLARDVEISFHLQLVFIKLSEHHDGNWSEGQ